MAASFSIPTPSAIRIRLPGNLTITGIMQGAAPTDLDVVRSLAGQTAALLGPFQAVFDLVETFQLVVETVQSVFSALTSFPPNPGKITAALNQLIAKVASLASYLPQLAIPRLAKDIIELVARNNSALRTEIASIAEQQSGADDIDAVATTLEDEGQTEAAAVLRESETCIRALIVERMNALSAGSGPIDDLLELINSLLGLVPGLPIPPLPTVGSLGTDPQAAVAILDAVDDALEPIRQALAGV